MSKRVSRLNWSIEPTLARFYKQAHKDLRGKFISVGKQYWSLFSVTEDDLRERNVDPKEYAYTVVAMLNGWLASKRMESVPPSVFCGEWVYGKFLKVYRSKSVQIYNPQEEKERILWNEVLVARTYIQRNLEEDRAVRLGTVVEEMRNLLYEGWLELYDNKGKRPILDAMEKLCEQYRVDDSRVQSYNDIVGMVRQRRAHLKMPMSSAENSV